MQGRPRIEGVSFFEFAVLGRKLSVTTAQRIGDIWMKVVMAAMGEAMKIVALEQNAGTTFCIKALPEVSHLRHRLDGGHFRIQQLGSAFIGFLIEPLLGIEAHAKQE